MTSESHGPCLALLGYDGLEWIAVMNALAAVRAAIPGFHDSLSTASVAPS